MHWLYIRQTDTQSPRVVVSGMFVNKTEAADTNLFCMNTVIEMWFLFWLASELTHLLTFPILPCFYQQKDTWASKLAKQIHHTSALLQWLQRTDGYFLAGWSFKRIRAFKVIIYWMQDLTIIYSRFGCIFVITSIHTVTLWVLFSSEPLSRSLIPNIYSLLVIKHLPTSLFSHTWTLHSSCQQRLEGQEPSNAL